MPVVEWSLDLLGVALAGVVLFALGVILRRRWLARQGGTFELALRNPDAPTGRGWVLGVGRYREDTLEWFRVFSLSLRPKCRWPRPQLSYETQRPPLGPESLAVYDGHVVVVCAAHEGHVELAMSPNSLTGLQAWLEASPPGARLGR